MHTMQCSSACNAADQSGVPVMQNITCMTYKCKTHRRSVYSRSSCVYVNVKQEGLGAKVHSHTLTPTAAPHKLSGVYFSTEAANLGVG